MRLSLKGAGYKKRSEIIIFAQPVCLGGQIAVDDIALLVLETPRDNDNDVALADPGTLLDLALDPAHPLHAVLAADPDVVCPHHQFRDGKLFVHAFFGQPYADNRCSVRIEFCRTGSAIGFFCIIINYNNSGAHYLGR